MVKKQLNAVVQIGVLFILPLIFFTFGSIPIEDNLFIILGVAVVAAIITLHEKQSLNALGIRFDNIKESIAWYLMLTILTVGIIPALAALLSMNTQNILANSHFIYGFVLISFLQEFLFRSFLIPKLKILLNSPVLVILINGLLFGSIHLFFSYPLLLFILSSVLGASFAFVYYYRPNLILATFSHSIINFVAVFYCFVSFNPTCV